MGSDLPCQVCFPKPISGSDLSKVIEGAAKAAGLHYIETLADDLYDVIVSDANPWVPHCKYMDFFPAFSVGLNSKSGYILFNNRKLSKKSGEWKLEYESGNAEFLSFGDGIDKVSEYTQVEIWPDGFNAEESEAFAKKMMDSYEALQLQAT